MGSRELVDVGMWLTLDQGLGGTPEMVPGAGAEAPSWK